MNRKRYVGSILFAALGLGSSASALSEAGFSAYVDSEGNIAFPADFRTSMVHLGSWFAPAGDASGFHDVYTQKESVDSYRETGEFPDGAVLVKELRGSLAGDYTTGKGVQHATGELKQWFVMVKDRKDRFAANPLWGEGWGWALFKPDQPGNNVATNYKVDCLGCHVPAKNDDWVYTEAYPILRE